MLLRLFSHTQPVGVQWADLLSDEAVQPHMGSNTQFLHASSSTLPSGRGNNAVIRRRLTQEFSATQSHSAVESRNVLLSTMVYTGARRGTAGDHQKNRLTKKTPCPHRPASWCRRPRFFTSTFYHIGTQCKWQPQIRRSTTSSIQRLRGDVRTFRRIVPFAPGGDGTRCSGERWQRNTPSWRHFQGGRVCALALATLEASILPFPDKICDALHSSA